MKVSVAPLAPPVPPDTGASTEAMPCFAASAWACFALSTSMVEQSMISAPLAIAGTTSVQTESTCLPAGSMVTTTSAPLTEPTALSAIRGAVGPGLIARGRHQVECGHLVAGLDQIGRHRAAHVAEADECDVCHVPFPPSAVSILSCRTPVRRRRSRQNKARPFPASRPRSAAATSCGLRSLSITAARTPSRKSSLLNTSSAARYSRTRHSSSEEDAARQPQQF